MKLITEVSDNVNYKILNEKNGEKKYFIEGVYLQADIKNRNGRIYPQAILAREVNNYVTNYINTKRSVGELGHPEGPSINLDRVSHLITSLTQRGSDFLGVAKIIDTPQGKIVKNLIDEGIRFGVSSRGLGSIRRVSSGIDEVQNDFFLSTIDIVSDPSAPSAFVQGIMENKEWIIENGSIQQINNYKRMLDTKTKEKLESKALKIFENFFQGLNNELNESADPRKTKTNPFS